MGGSSDSSLISININFQEKSAFSVKTACCFPIIIQAFSIPGCACATFITTPLFSSKQQQFAVVLSKAGFLSVFCG